MTKGMTRLSIPPPTLRKEADYLKGRRVQLVLLRQKPSTIGSTRQEWEDAGTTEEATYLDFPTLNEVRLVRARDRLVITLSYRPRHKHYVETHVANGSYFDIRHLVTRETNTTTS